MTVNEGTVAVSSDRTGDNAAYMLSIDGGTVNVESGQLQVIHDVDLISGQLNVNGAFSAPAIPSALFNS